MTDDPKPLARAQFRIALVMAQDKQLKGRRDLRAEIRHVTMAKLVDLRQKAFRKKPFKESLDDSIRFVARQFKVDPRTVETARSKLKKERTIVAR